MAEKLSLADAAGHNFNVSLIFLFIYFLISLFSAIEYDFPRYHYELIDVSSKKVSRLESILMSTVIILSSRIPISLAGLWHFGV